MELQARLGGSADAGASRVAVVTGASMGLGRAVATRLVGSGWRVVADARDGDRLRRALAGLPEGGVVAIPGDVADPWHRGALAAAVAELGRLDLLVNNASSLGPSPLPRLREMPLDALARVYAVNVLAPLGLAQALIGPLEASGGRIVNVSSDAGAEAYPGWGGYGSSKAALDHLTAVLAVEHPGLRVYAFDPGDMETAMHQRAFPGEDIRDRPPVASVVPAVMRLVGDDLPSGRYRVDELRAARAA